MYQDRTVVIDFQQCLTTSEKIYIPTGNFAYEIAGFEGERCVLRFGGKVQDYTLNESLTTTCKIPIGLGPQEFKVKEYGIDFSSIFLYCKEPSKPFQPNYTSLILFGIVSFLALVVLVTVLISIRIKKSRSLTADK
ncbi:MAG: hypothetical protein AAB443_03675 [Patescibacteria group bacterium]